MSVSPDLPLESIAPYVSCTLFSISGKKSADVIKLMSTAGLFNFDALLKVGEPDSARYRPGSAPLLVVPPDQNAWASYYRERSLPSWLASENKKDVIDADSPLVDEVHRLVTAVARRNYIALIATEDRARQTIEDRWLEDKSVEKCLSLVSRKQLHAAFAHRPAKTLWLHGVHRPTMRKPASKILIGNWLQQALNPLDDQTFAYSAARCAIADQLTVGFAPGRGRVWVRGAKSWSDFVDVVERLTKVLSTPPAPRADDGDDLSTVLAQPLDSGALVASPSAAVIADPLLLLDATDEAPPHSVVADVMDRGRLVVQPLGNGAAVSSSASFGLSVEVDGDTLATFAVSVDQQLTGNAKVSVKRTSPSPKDAQQLEAVNEFTKYIRRKGALSVWYDSGHSLSHGWLYGNQHRTIQFRGWSWTKFGSYPITEEKPTKPSGKLTSKGNPRLVYDPDAIGIKKASLFCWLVKERKSCLPTADGWLICDDGSLEISDFVYFSPSAKVLTLLHLKGAGSSEDDRQVSVGDYEIVVAQTIKNLRWLYPDRLRDRLQQRAGKTTPKLVWKRGATGGWQKGKWNECMAALDGFQPETREVVIVQPSLRKSLYDIHSSPLPVGVQPKPDLVRLWQLDYLLLGAQASCRAFGAELTVLGDGSC